MNALGIRPLRTKAPLPATFGRWRVLGDPWMDLEKQTSFALCSCSCGRSIRPVALRDLRRGQSTQCRQCGTLRGRK